MAQWPGVYSNDRYTQQVIDLLLRRGDIAAQQAGQRGQLWGQAVQNIGQIGAEAYAQHAQQKREQRLNQVMSTWDGQDPQALYRATAPIVGAKAATQLMQSAVAFQEFGLKRDEHEQKRLGVALGAVEQLPDQTLTSLYPELRRRAVGLNMPVQDWPEEYDPQLRPALTRVGQLLRGEKPAQPSYRPVTTDKGIQMAESTTGTLGPVVAQAPPKTATPKPEPSPGTFEAFVAANPGQDVLKLRAQWEAAGRKPETAGEEGAVELSGAALDIAAKRYLTDGTLPPMGMGKAGAGARKAIINRAAVLDPDANLAANAADYSANRAALGVIQKQYDAVTAFERTAEKNSALFEELLKKIPNAGTRFINAPLRAVASQVGSEDIAAFNTIRQSVQNEYARIISNPTLAGVMSDSARREAETLLSPDSTVAQFRAALRTLASEAKNRRTSYQEQIDTINGRIRGVKAGESSSGWTELPGGIRIREKP